MSPQLGNDIKHCVVQCDVVWALPAALILVLVTLHTCLLCLFILCDKVGDFFGSDTDLGPHVLLR